MVNFQVWRNRIAGLWRTCLEAVRPLVQRITESKFAKRIEVLLFPENERQYTDPSYDFLNPDPIIRRGMYTVGIFVLGFLGWAIFAPLDSAIVAPGTVVVESHRKGIQHLEGGIVDKINVREGQTVVAGQSLVQLDDTEARATLDLIRGEADAMAAQQARLEAERDSADKITFPAELLARMSDPKVAAAIRGEQNSFDTNRQTLSKQQAIYQQRISEDRRLAGGMEAEQKSLEQQAALILQETESVQRLYEKGLSTLPRLLQLRRQAAELTGQRGQIIAKIAQVHLDSGENDLQIMNLKNQFMSTVVKDLRDVQTRRFQALDRLHAAKDVVSRLRMTAPVSGKVVSLSVHNKGAVIRPGELVMEIVPLADSLEVETRIRPEDINSVHIGMVAKVGLSAYKQRRLPMIIGTVTNISADRLSDPRTGLAYFNVQVAVDRSKISQIPDVKLIPGMPVDVALDTGSRTAMNYFTEPIVSVWRRGMKEH